MIWLIMGELSKGLETLLVRAFSRLIAENPFFQEYEGQILGCIIGLPLCWWLLLAYKEQRAKATKHIRAAHISSAEMTLPAVLSPHSESVQRNAAFKTSKANIINMLNRVRVKFGIEATRRLRIPLVVSILALFVAAFMEMPEDFFVLLRVLLFVTCLVAAATLWKTNSGTLWLWSLAVLAVIYEPFLPIHLEEDTWEMLNLATVPVLGFLCFVITPPTPPVNSSIG